jgi:hypothetical protein
MKHLIRNAMVALMGIGLVGCEWGGGGDDNSWNSSGSIANFSGNYQANGSYLVSEYTATEGVSSSTTSGGVTYNTYSEDGGNTGANKVSFSGRTGHGLVKPGSVVIVFGGVSGSAYDNGSGGMAGSYVLGVTNSPVTGGHFEYDTGVWTLQLAPPGLPVNQSITISYSAAGVATDDGSDDDSGGTGGASSFAIYAFNVQQSGNKVKIIDNNGSVYEGSLGDVRTTGNLSSSSSGSGLVAGDQVIAPFSAAGRSKSGMHVNMAGNFQGTVAGVTSVSEASGSTTTIKTSFALTSRVIQGTWIEDGGQTGNINGVSPSSANVSFSSTISTNAP